MRKIFTSLAVTVLLSLTASFASADIVTSLQDSWALDGDATSSTGTHDGTYTNNGAGTETYVAGKFGQGIDLERGNGEYLDIQNSASDFDNIGGSITVSAWVDFEDNQSNWQAVVSNGEGGAWRMATGRNADRSQPFWAAGGDGAGGGGSDIGSGGTEFDPADTGFHLLVGTFDGATNLSSFYVDGVLTGTVTNAGGLTDSNGNAPAGIVIGTNGDDTGRNFDGIIDDVGIWDIALTQADVDQIWNGGNGTAVANLVAVPEPSSLALLIFGAAGLVSRRRKS